MMPDAQLVESGESSTDIWQAVDAVRYRMNGLEERLRSATGKDLARMKRDLDKTRQQLTTITRQTYRRICLVATQEVTRLVRQPRVTVVVSGLTVSLPKSIQQQLRRHLSDPRFRAQYRAVLTRLRHYAGKSLKFFLANKRVIMQVVVLATTVLLDISVSPSVGTVAGMAASLIFALVDQTIDHHRKDIDRLADKLETSSGAVTSGDDFDARVANVGDGPHTEDHKITPGADYETNRQVSPWERRSANETRASIDWVSWWIDANGRVMEVPYKIEHGAVVPYADAFKLHWIRVHLQLTTRRLQIEYHNPVSRASKEALINLIVENSRLIHRSMVEPTHEFLHTQADREAAKKAGEYDVQYAEDVDSLIRLVEKRLKVARPPRPTVPPKTLSSADLAKLIMTSAHPLPGNMVLTHDNKLLAMEEWKSMPVEEVLSQQTPDMVCASVLPYGWWIDDAGNVIEVPKQQHAAVAWHREGAVFKQSGLNVGINSITDFVLDQGWIRLSTHRSQISGNLSLDVEYTAPSPLGKRALLDLITHLAPDLRTFSTFSVEKRKYAVRGNVMVTTDSKYEEYGDAFTFLDHLDRIKTRHKNSSNLAAQAERAA